MTLDARDLPPAARLSWWGTAWLAGAVDADTAVDAVLGGEVAHVVVGADAAGWPALPGPGVLPFLAAAAERGATGVAAVFPAPGDPVGLRGPASLSAAAIEAGEAVLLLGAGAALVPRLVGRAVEWEVYPAERRPPPDLGEADRGLRTAVLAAADGLARLDVAAWAPEVADELHDLRGGASLAAPPGVPEQCVRLLGRALHLERVVDLALADDGGALGSHDAAQRRDLVGALAGAVRLAMTAACSPDGWPPPRS